MPMTGAVASERAASSPVSSKQGDDVRVDSVDLAFADFLQQPGQTERAVEVSLIEAGPSADVAATISVPALAAARAATAILSVIVAVVLGLRRVSASPAQAASSCRARRRRRMVIVASATRMIRNENAVVTVPSA